MRTTDRSIDRAKLQAAFREAGLPDIAVPAEVRVVDKIPLLGTGKTDYVALAASFETPRQAA